jgi:hypothetical protein
MAKSAPRPANPVEALLEERNRYQMWLARLDQAGSSAPAAVRDRIRDDYHRRLGEVIEQLRSHAAAVTEQLAALQARQAELRQREGDAQETLAEAELRHAVGEFDTGEWDRVRGENERVLLGVREDLSRVGEDIARLLEVQELISAPPVPAPAPAPPPTLRAGTPAPTPPPATVLPAPAASDADDWEPEFPLADPSEPTPAKAPPVGAPKFTPRSGPAKGKELPPRTLPFPAKTPEPAADEMAFLKSVSDETVLPKRTSGSTPRVADAGITPAEPPGGGQETGQQKIVLGGDRSSQSATPKTLKCGECGAFNRPTEWYCERCGAELAAL